MIISPFFFSFSFLLYHTATYIIMTKNYIYITNNKENNAYKKHLWHNMNNHQKLLKVKAGPSPLNIYNKLKLGTEQLAKLLKKTKAK